MPAPIRFATERASTQPPARSGQHDQDNTSARQSRTKLQYNDGRSFKMRGFEQLTKRFKVAGVVLLLLITALGMKASAQSLNPIPWPTPAAVPPAPPIIPLREGNMPTGFQITGFIQYASLDATPGLCNKDDNPTPTPANPPLPAQCKITGGWVEVNNTVIRVPQSTVVIFPNTLLTWEEAFELNPTRIRLTRLFKPGWRCLTLCGSRERIKSASRETSSAASTLLDLFISFRTPATSPRAISRNSITPTA